jgi:hypothetical protein
MTGRKEILLFILMLNMSYCSSQGRNQKVFDSYLNSISTDNEITELKNNLKDSVQKWINMGLYYVLFLDKTTWKIDEAVFLNKQKNKALMLVLIQPKDILWGMDYAKLIGAEKIDEKWKFYYASYPLSVFDRKNINKMPLDTIARKTRWELVEDGFVKCNPLCKINYNYVDSDVWFSEWRRKKHVKFLLNALEIDPREKPGDSPY